MIKPLPAAISNHAGSTVTLLTTRFVVSATMKSEMITGTIIVFGE